MFEAGFDVGSRLGMLEAPPTVLIMYSCVIGGGFGDLSNILRKTGFKLVRRVSEAAARANSPKYTFVLFFVFFGCTLVWLPICPE